ncbi:MAG: molecular chaperone HtpG [Epsilonproteobacteria bacterium]|nr:MAG: molecular chaperone HtpG [Campylobacterota bacterium]RLA67649.1 MAG: molecular chaperone HtpG [Campylobacterota bacterium]
MTARTGTISVKTSDIFPIIKKWLYSEHDIFLRELVANATDAITKRAGLGRTRNEKIPEGEISVSVNKGEKTIIISDNGLGMSETEVEKYIAQLAFSGAEEFVKKIEKTGEKEGEIIGKFGLGFYSSFMVAAKVDIETLSMEEGAKATKWTCEGDTDYSFSDSDKKDVGTTITLHVNKDGEEFLDLWKVTNTLQKFCDYMPYKIKVEDAENKTRENDKGEIEQVEPTLINEIKPLWKRDPKEVKDEEYKEFFKKMFPMEQEPLFWVHLKIDHPFTLEGILYFPKINTNKPFNESNIKLYCKQVFVSDNVKNIIPDFLSMLRGVIDSNDIPLNVSRSSLQGDPNIRKISNYIVKKVGDALKTLFRKDREKFEKIWPDIGLFVKYGCISEAKFDEILRSMVIFKNSEDKYMTLEEYQGSIPKEYTEKMKDLVLYFEDGVSDYNLKNHLWEKGVGVIHTDGHIDPHFMQHVETQKRGDNTYRFSSVDSEIGNILESENVAEEDMKVKDLFSKVLFGDQKEEEKTEVVLQKLKDSNAPAYYKIDEQMRRFSKMAESMGGNEKFPIKKTFVVNPANTLIQNALKMHEKGEHKGLVNKLCHHVEDLANISSGGLNNEERDSFVQRSQELLKELTGLAL